MKQVFFALMCCVCLSSCGKLKTLKMMKGGEVQKGSFSDKIPFERLQNVFVVKVFIKGKPYNFVFDTGANITALSDKVAKELGLQPKAQLSLNDSQGKERKVDLYPIESLKIGNTTFTNQTCVVTDFTKMSTVGENIDGILGVTLMRKAVWLVDNAHQTIAFANDRNSLPKLENAFKTPFTCEAFVYSPRITILLDGFAYTVEFDSGSNNGVSLNKKVVTNAQKKADLMNAPFSVGNARIGLYGRGKLDTTYFLKTQKIQFGGVDINSQQFVKIRRNSSSLLGMKILKNYNFILDWHTKEILLTPINEVPKDVINPWGFDYGFEENSMKITEIFNNSDAAKKGLMLGDVVLKINEKSYQNLSKKEQYDIVLGDLMPKESSEAHLVVQRNKEEIKIDLKK
jgi:hypothetical protein